VCLALLSAGSLFAPALKAGKIDAIYAFGDSLSDVGNIYAATAVPGPSIPGSPYVNGQFTNGNVWVQNLALDFGLAPLAPSLLGGTNYAYGSGETGVTPFNTAIAGTDLLGSTGQLAQFEASHPSADPNALYTIWIGSNDLTDILSDQTPAQYTADIATVVGNIDTAINTLAGVGAKNFLIATVPDLGKTPASLAAGTAVSSAASGLSLAFDTLLVNGSGPVPSLAAVAGADGINISVLNTFALLDSIAANPSAFGFTNVTQPCLTGAVNYSGGTVCGNPNQYLFWDALHPSAAADAIVAADAFALLTPEPASVSLIAAGLVGLAALAHRLRAR
jgi:phospholipase/lecithinase/hemolysin